MILNSTVLLLVFLVPTLARSWGENGHDIVTRTAVHLLETKTVARSKELTHLFVQKQHMLAHLSNVPDILWRASSQPKDVIVANATTHYVGLDKLIKSTKDCAKLVAPASDAERLLAQGNLSAEAGTAIWRTEQIYKAMVDSFRMAAQTSGTEYDKAVAQGLLYAGILAHFIGDLAQPLHSTSDYDGVGSNQAGLHAYFESEVVDAYDVGLIATVFQHAKVDLPYKTALAPFVTAQKNVSLSLKAAAALTCNSFDAIPTLLKVDQTTSLLKKSAKGFVQIPAQRKDPKDVTQDYKNLVVDRLALGADTLATLWYEGWVEAGRPDLSQYKSFDYAMTPDFIKVNYLR